MELINELSLTVIGILIEAAPFVVLAALFLFVLDVLRAEEFLAKRLSGPIFVAVLTAVVLGVFLPFCECCIVPLYRRLVNRGVPIPAAIAFLIAAPSLNFVVIANTFVATNGNAGLMGARFGISAALAVVFAFAASVFLKNSAGSYNESYTAANMDMAARLRNALDRAVSDLLLMLGLLVFGAVVIGLFHMGLHKYGLEILEQKAVLNVSSMMIISAIISTCAASDASIAMTLQHFPDIAKLGFMIIGPVVDIKLVVMHMKMTERKTAAFVLLGFPVFVVLALVIFSLVS